MKRMGQGYANRMMSSGQPRRPIVAIKPVPAKKKPSKPKRKPT